jgi:hypothetical protein
LMLLGMAQVPFQPKKKKKKKKRPTFSKIFY